MQESLRPAEAEEEGSSSQTPLPCLQPETTLPLPNMLLPTPSPPKKTPKFLFYAIFNWQLSVFLFVFLEEDCVLSSFAIPTLATVSVVHFVSFHDSQGCPRLKTSFE